MQDADSNTTSSLLGLLFVVAYIGGPGSHHLIITGIISYLGGNTKLFHDIPAPSRSLQQAVDPDGVGEEVLHTWEIQIAVRT